MLRSCIAFAWINLVRGDRARLMIAMGGAVVAIFTLLLHLALVRAIEHKAAQVYGLFDAQLVMISDRYQFLYRMGDFPSARLRQAVSVAGVESAAAVRVASSRWIAREGGAQSSLLLIGIDPDPVFLRDADLRATAAALRAPRHVLLDRLSDADVEILPVGDRGRIGVNPATVAGTYDLGLPMYAAATAIVSNADFSFYSGEHPQRMQLGLLRLQTEADAARAIAALREALPDDVRVMTRAALMKQEADYFIEVKPLGIMLRTGLIIGLIVGVVALFQIMSSQIESRMRDFAVMRAMGFSATYTYLIGAWQLLLMGSVAFVGAWLLAIPVFVFVAAKTHLFLPLDPWLLGSSLALSVPMIASAALPLVRAARAEPARLFAAA